jgi:hypothetical protein
MWIWWLLRTASSAMRGTMRSDHKCFISRGTPGVKNMRQPVRLTLKPGAVPISLGRISAPSGKSACFSLVGDMVRPREANRPRMRSSEA